MKLTDAPVRDISKVSMYAPITKFEEQPDGSLIFQGFATTERLDGQNEIATQDGADRAIEKWGGNVREMHQPEAVGSSLDVVRSESPRGYFIRGRVSAGAPNTIIKVKDGTLKGLSVGGVVLPNGRVGVRVTSELAQTYGLPPEKVGKAITMLKDWEMTELSLVDAPANPDCMISIAKMSNGQVAFSDVIAKGEMEEFTADVKATPNEAPEEPAAPMEDEKQIVACLLAARRHLEAAAKLEVDEMEEHGSGCLDTITGCINAIRGVERMKVMQGAAETAGTSVVALTPQTAMDNMVAMAAKIDGVAKGMMTYKIDPKESKALKAMMDQLDEMKASIQTFIDSNAADVKGGDKGEESPDPGEAAPAPGDVPPDAAKAATAPGAPPPGEAEKVADPNLAKAAKADDVQKAAAVAADPILKAIADLRETVEKRVSETEATVARIAKAAAPGGPIRSAIAVEKTIAGFPVAKSAAGIEDALSGVFAKLEQAGRAPTEQDVRRELALWETKAALRRG